MIVKINPRDVVSVPEECNCEKLRTARYEVVGEYQGELRKPLYSASFNEDEYNDDEDEDNFDMGEDYWGQYDEDEEFGHDDEDHEESDYPY